MNSAILNAPIESGYTVTTIVRNLDKIKTTDPVTPIKANVLHDDTLANLINGYDAVINSFSSDMGSKYL